MLYKEDLMKLKCGNPNCKDPVCDTLFFNQACHQGAPMDVIHCNGVITVSCRVCGTEIMKIAVASKPRRKPTPLGDIAQDQVDSYYDII